MKDINEMTHEELEDMPLPARLKHNADVVEMLEDDPELFDKLEFLNINSYDWGKSNAKHIDEMGLVNILYRIKPEPKYKPYSTFTPDMVGKIVKSKNEGACKAYELIVAISKYGVYPSSDKYVIPWDNLFENFEWYNPVTGETSPCGEVA